MSKIFELYGYPLSDRSPEAEKNRKLARCPFMGATCDGGGNRYSSSFDLSSSSTSQELKDYFNRNSGQIQSGVCSLTMNNDEEPPWIVCPRRLLTLGKRVEGYGYQNQSEVLESLLRHATFTRGDEIGIWPELRIRYDAPGDDEDGSFHYTFDYLLMPIKRTSITTIQELTGLKKSQIRTVAQNAGYGLTSQANELYIDGFPSGNPVIVEVMTSSTSGGNHRKRTTVSMSFEDALLGKDHTGPNINKRQVWARMVSQLIVKSQVGLAWSGKTIWVVQENLVDYIAKTTGLNIYRLVSGHTNEVNMLSFTYGDKHLTQNAGIINLREDSLFSGPMTSSSEQDGTPVESFSNIIKIGTVPPLTVLYAKLLETAPVGTFTI